MSKLGTILIRQLGKVQATLEVQLKLKLKEELRKLEKQCPTGSMLTAVERLVNTASKGVLVAEKQIKQVDKSVKSIETLTKNTNRAIQVILAISIPVAIIPPQVGGVGVPTSVLNKYSRNLIQLSDKVSTLDSTVRSIRSVITPIKEMLQEVKELLREVENRLERCKRSTTLENVSVEPVTGQTTSLTVFDTTQTNETGVSSGEAVGLQEIYKGYNISIEQDPNSPKIAPRKYAVVINSKGILIYKGELSFSKQNQILIEEARFEVDKQDIS